MQGLKKVTKERTVSGAPSNSKRQQEYSIDYEAYRHFAFFAGVLLEANSPEPTRAVDLVKWYLTEKAYCVPRVVEDSGDGNLQLLPNKYFLLWAWKDFALEFDLRMRATPF